MIEPQKQVQFNEHDNIPIEKKSNQLITSEDGKTGNEWAILRDYVE